MKKIGIHDPLLGAGELQSLSATIDSNWISGRGPAVAEFETVMADFFGTKTKPLATVNGSAALLLALRIAGVKPGDHVLCSAYGFVATANAIRRIGAEPIFLGPENPEYPVVTAAQLKIFFAENLTSDRMFRPTGRPVRGMLYNEPYGLAAPCLSDMVGALEERGMFLAEDSSQALGHKLGESFLGTLGHLGIFSLNGNKTLTTGAGGLLLMKNTDWMEKARRLAAQSRSDEFDFFYDDVAYNFDLSNLLAAVGLAQARRLPEILARKREIRSWYREFLHGWKLLDEKADYPAWLNVVLTARPMERASFSALAMRLGAAGICVRPAFPAVTENAHFREAPLFWGQNIHYLFPRGLCLPSGPGLVREEVRKVADMLASEGSALGFT